MTNEKYELLPEQNDSGCHRIRALLDFGDVKRGDLGGFIENESCLSFMPDDCSWVYDNSSVIDSAVIDSSVIYSSVSHSSVSHSTVRHSSVSHSSVIGGTVIGSIVRGRTVTHRYL